MTIAAHLAALRRRAVDRLRAMGPRAILVVGWIVFALYAYPGYMSSDSVDQLQESRFGQFNDWHSPTMNEVWRLIGYVASGPIGMLVLQSGLLLVGAASLLRRVMSPRAAALTACGLLIFPPVMAPIAVVWPDSQMAGFLIAGAAALADQRRGRQVLGLVLLFLACAMRETSAIAALPIAIAGIAFRTDQPRWARYGIAIAAWLGMVVGAAGLDAALRTHATHHLRVELAASDVVGVLQFAGPLSDQELRDVLVGVPLATRDGIQARARDLYARDASIMYDAQHLIDAPTTDAERDALMDAQVALVRAHPGAYLQHRWTLMSRNLALRRRPSFQVVFTAFTGGPKQEEAAGHASMHSKVQGALVAYVRVLSRTFLFSPFVYLAIAVVLLPLAIRRRDRVAAILLASGLAYEASLFLVTTTAEFRFSHWLVTSTVLAIVLMVTQGVARARPAAEPQGAEALARVGR